MKRKVTALLLAMAFVLATVAPTLAASGTGKNAEKNTATVSEEKSRSKWKPLGAVVKLLAPKKDENNSYLIDQYKKYSDEGYIPDWEYMEKFIERLETRERVKALLGMR